MLTRKKFTVRRGEHRYNAQCMLGLSVLAKLAEPGSLLPYCLTSSTLLVEPGTPVVEKS